MGAVASAVGSLFGGGSNNPTPQSANIQHVVTPEQAAMAGQQMQTGLTGQQDLAQQLAAQGGMQNQQATADMLMRMAQGQGPSVAQNQLQNSTGANIANQAALMAGQRGAGANAGLMAREAAMQGANIQQQAAGQGAQMRAQEQMAATGQLGQLANQQVANQMQGQAQYGQLAGQQQQNLLGSVNAANQAEVQNVAGQNQANATLAGSRAQMGGQIVGGLLGGAGAVLAAAKGGMVPDHLHQVGQIYHPGHFACGGMAQGGAINGEVHAQTMQPVPGKASVPGDSLKNDTVDAKLSPGELIIPRSVMESKDPVAAGTKFLIEALKKNGKAGGEESDFKSALQKAAGGRK